MISSKTVIAIPPGATIKEQLEDRNMSQKEFAKRMDMSEKHISKLINGEVLLTTDMALNLEMVLGVPAHFWSNLESLYREKLAKVIVENEMDEDIKIAKKFPYKNMVRYGWVEDTRNETEIVINLRKFFEVVKLELLDLNLIPSIACRRMAVHEKADYALIAWAQKAKLEARNIQTKAINIHGLEKRISTIRSMTSKNPEIFCKELVDLLAEVGVALVFLPHIDSSFLHGATFYDGKKIVIGLTVRGKDADRFWFSLFHEIGHILKGHINQAQGTTDQDEKDADDYSKEVLIPQFQFNYFIEQNDFSKSSIIAFSKQIGIDSGIVVGRLQKEAYIDFSWHNDLKKKYSIIE